MAVSIYQDLSCIKEDVETWLCAGDTTSETDTVVVNAWRILCTIPNPDKYQYDTVIHSVVAIFGAGRGYEDSMKIKSK